MKRRLFTLASGLSLLLCVGAAVLWVRASNHLDWVRYEEHHQAEYRRHRVLDFKSKFSALTAFAGASTLPPEKARSPKGIKYGLTFGSQILTAKDLLYRRPRHLPLGPSLYTGLERDINFLFWGFAFRYWVVRDNWGEEINVMIEVPEVSIVVVSAVLPLSWLSSRLRSRRRINGNTCPACGYSLTGNVSGVCPECGTQTKSPAGGGGASKDFLVR